MGYTNLTDTQISGLTIAGAKGRHRAVYEAITRAHELQMYPGNESWCFRPIADIMRITAYGRDTCSRAVRDLCEMEFMPGVTVLKRVGGGHRGQATVYDDQLWTWSEFMEGEPMTPDANGKGVQQSPTNQERKGVQQSPTNSDAERCAETPGKVCENRGKVCENDAKGVRQSHTQNRNPEEIPRLDTQISGKERANTTTVQVAGERLDECYDFLWGALFHGTSSTLSQVRAWYRRKGEGPRAELDALFLRLDAMAKRLPVTMADLTDAEAGAVAEASRTWNLYGGTRGDFTLYDAWLILTWQGGRDAAWVRAFDAWE